MYDTRRPRTCPHCGKTLSLAAKGDYFYGSPLKKCKYCKQYYIDRRYHEIAIEGVREKDTRLPTKEERRADRKDGLKKALIGFGGVVLSFVLFGVGIETGYIVCGAAFILIGSTPLLFSGLGKLFKRQSIRKLNKNLSKIEEERKKSVQRMLNPKYIARLQAEGYDVTPYFTGQE